jgi:hypothetical protein
MGLNMSRWVKVNRIQSHSSLLLPQLVGMRNSRGCLPGPGLRDNLAKGRPRKEEGALVFLGLFLCAREQALVFFALLQSSTVHHGGWTGKLLEGL